MIAQLQLSSFVREKVRYLSTVARDMVQRLSLFDLEGEPEPGDIDESIDERDVAEFLASLESMDSDESLWEPASSRWLPRHAYAGVLQSALDDYYRVNDAVAPAVNVFGEHLVVDPLSSANLRQQLQPGHGAGRFTLNRKDPRWVLVLYAKYLKRRHGRAPFGVNPDGKALARDARMLLVGDWASGIPGAIQVAATMRSKYITPVLGHREIHVVHLGDVYHAGLAKEYRKHFLRHWPVHKAEQNMAFSWCLPGNHDMYAGGRTFFDMLAGDSRFAAQNNASYFLLENEDWQVFGLDSAYEPIDYKGDTGVLYGEQTAWFARTRAKTAAKKCLLLTHHQPFSAYESPKEDFARRFRPVADAGEITAWFWGHEHACAHYEASNGIEHPVLLGHGGFPQRPLAQRHKAFPFRFEWTITSVEGDLVFGFAVLDFDADHIDVQLVDQSGSVHHSFRI
jgi:hypothetical protein